MNVAWITGHSVELIGVYDALHVTQDIHFIAMCPVFLSFKADEIGHIPPARNGSFNPRDHLFGSYIHE